MYIPDIYKNENEAEIRDFLYHNSFGLLISQVNGRPWATHIPIELDVNADGHNILHGHISKENPQWQNFGTGNEILAVFSGPDAYISSSWYDHENVPTWNYTAVHVYGKIRLLDGHETIASLKKLVDRYETGQENPVRIEALSKKTMRQVHGIVGFEIEITEIQAKRKMSQNRDPENHERILAKLDQSTAPNAKVVAEEMRRIRNKR